MESLGIPRVDGVAGRRPTRGGSGSCSAITSTCSAARRAARGCGTSSRTCSASTEPLDARNGDGDLRPDSGAPARSRDFRPRALFDRFNIEVLCTTDAATDTLEHHAAIRDIGLEGRRPADVPARPRDQHPPSELARGDRSPARADGQRITSFDSYIRRARGTGARSSRRWAPRPPTMRRRRRSRAGCRRTKPRALFDRALAGEASADDARVFTGHMLIEMARMSVEDGLVMQLHPGSDRNHNARSSSASAPIAAATSRCRPSTRAT